MAGFKVTDAGATDAVNFTIPRSGFWIGLIVSVKSWMNKIYVCNLGTGLSA